VPPRVADGVLFKKKMGLLLTTKAETARYWPGVTNSRSVFVDFGPPKMSM
jgi:hypothetical protein